MPHGDARSIARLNHGRTHAVCFPAALVVSQCQATNDTSRDGVWIDQAGDVTSQSLCGSPSASEHILELAALLQQHCQRLLPTLQGNDDIGELRRYHAHGRSRLGCADPGGPERPLGLP